MIAQFLARQGLPEGRVMLEDRARSTRDNAIFSLPLARPQPGERWLLVTSAMHMPRSIGVFRSAGWPELQPWPVDYRTTGRMELAGEPVMGDAAGRARCTPPTSGALSSIIACWAIRAHLPRAGAGLISPACPFDVRGAPCRAEPWFFSSLSPGLSCARSALATPTAKELFGAVATPAPATGPHVIGSYAKGCLAGGVALPIDGPAWQAMRLSRNRNWGDPG